MEVQRENQRLRQELGDLRAEQDRHPLGRGTNGLEERSEQVQRLEAMVSVCATNDGNFTCITEFTWHMP